MKIKIRNISATVEARPQNMFVLCACMKSPEEQRILQEFSEYIGARILQGGLYFMAEMTGDTREHLLGLYLEKFNAACDS